MDAHSAAASGMQTASEWLYTAASNIAASAGGPDPTDAVAAYVEAPIAFAANSRVLEAAVSTTRCLLDVLA